jgi:hypothetical protein
MEIRADIRTPLTAGLAGEAWFNVWQPNVIRPSVAADRGPVAAMVVGAIDQETANAGGSHFSEGDLLFAFHWWRVTVIGGIVQRAPFAKRDVGARREIANLGSATFFLFFK